jgi:hypothetical protein
MFPYIARVISHPVNWSVHTMALLLRSRLEANRTRTVERSTLQLQALIDQMPTSDSSPQERLAYFWSIGLPSSWEMEREVAKRYASLGVVKSAMEVFERLEMWEEVVHCWQALERPDKGLEIVRDLLEGKKEEADAVVLKGKEAKRNVKPVLDRAREANSGVCWESSRPSERSSTMRRHGRCLGILQVVLCGRLVAIGSLEASSTGDRLLEEGDDDQPALFAKLVYSWVRLPTGREAGRGKRRVHSLRVDRR